MSRKSSATLRAPEFSLALPKKNTYHVPVMPIATPEQYITMLETAKKEGYAYPAVNVTTIEVINGALRAFSEAKSDGIIQVSIGGGKFASGTSIGSSALGQPVPGGSHAPPG